MPYSTPTPFYLSVRGFLCALMVMLSVDAISQDWPYSDSRWQYDFNVAGGLIGTFEMRVAGDTILNYFNAKVIEQRNISYWPQQGGEYTISIGEFSTVAFIMSSVDSVFYWSDSQFYLLYDFSSEIGDTWLVDISTSGFPDCQDSAFVSVIGNGIMDVNGFPRRFIDLVTDSESEYGLSGRAIEGIGLVNETYNYGYTLFPGIHPCGSVIVDGYDTGFKCYSDNVIGNYSPDGENCWFIGIEEYQDPVINVFPNPANEELRIGFAQTPVTNTVESVRIIDGKGKIFMADLQHVSEEELKINISDFSPGLYTLTITFQDYIISKRFLKN